MAHRRPGNSSRYGVAYAQGYLLGVGQIGVEVAHSMGAVSVLDGGLPHRRSPLTIADLFAVGANNGVVVSVGARGVIVTSIDVKTWASRSSGTTEDLFGLGFSIISGWRSEPAGLC
ncbi:MAG TPA: hypothetical protein PLN52_19580 [Opitutaceae bacterium]|nr:hypothetical protein [Opitutaceae bacterium]